MPTIRTLLRAAAVAAGSSTALVVGGLLGSANADPVPPAPVPNIGEQLANTAASAPQMFQNLAGAFTGAAATPPAPSPLASAGIQVPQPPAAVPGPTSAMPGATPLTPGATALVPGANSLVPGATAPPANPATPGITSGIPGLTPAAPAATSPAQLLPSAHIDLPQLPFLPVPLPQQLSLPGDLASLGAGGVPVPRSSQPGTTAMPTPAPAPATSGSPLSSFPLSALP
jgi:hypothetical protein